MKYTIEISSYRPASLNQLLRVHWAKRNRMKAADKQAIAVAVLMAVVPRAKGKRRVRMTITLTGRMKPTDNDNAFKSVLDALVACKALIDDSPEYVETLPVEYVRGAALATRIELEDVENE